MGTMKIGEETENYSAADFSFPNNPRVVDIDLIPSREFSPVRFSNFHIVTDTGSINPKMLVLTGELFGSSKRSNFNTLAGHITDNNVKKFFIDSDRFYYVLGGPGGLKETNQGTRTNFIDYVGQLWTPIPFTHSNTESTYTVGLTTATATTLNDATSGSTGIFSNTGNAPAFVKWEVENTGSQNITQIEIGDLAVSGGNVAGDRILTWVGTLAPGSTWTFFVFKFVTQTSGFKVMEYNRTEIDGTKSGSRTLSYSLLGPPRVTAGSTDQSFSIKLTGTDGATVTATYREANLS